ncbi:MAG: hemolysin family protein [Pseudomonadota bacterium]
MSEGNGNGNGAKPGVVKRLLGRLRPRPSEAALREAIEEIVGQVDQREGEDGEAPVIGSRERMLLSNILNLRHLTAYDVMVPRADIDAVDVETGFAEFMDVISKRGHSRLPVYRETLDDIVGFVHLKDAIPFASDPAGFQLDAIKRPPLFIAPSALALDLLLEMRLSRRHMALVVDEYGGVDGLITIEDLVEEIVGEIEDEHDLDETEALLRGKDGTILADARMLIEDLEEEIGPILSEEEREADIDTIGGLVATLAGRVPARGELIPHPASGVTFEVVEADPRRLKRLRLRDLPNTGTESTTGTTAAES